VQQEVQEALVQLEVQVLLVKWDSKEITGPVQPAQQEIQVQQDTQAQLDLEQQEVQEALAQQEVQEALEI
jgi:hypothetical protein